MNIPKSNNQHAQQPITADDLHHIFSHISPQDVEGFYQLYQLWQLQQKRTTIQQQLQGLEELLSTKESSLLEVTPSAIAQAALSQFRASGINNIDLLERMLARGDHWLDHTWELFERYQRLGMIQNNAIEWCEHALEDTYGWLESISCPNNISNISLHSIAQHTKASKASFEAHKLAPTSENIISLNAYSYNNLLLGPLHPSHQQPPDAEDRFPATTEEDFLHKLMSNEESKIHTSSHSNIPPILAARSDVAYPVASASEAENSVLSATTPIKQSEPNIASDTINEQETTLSTSPQETLNLRPDNDQDTFSTTEEQPQPEQLKKTLFPPLEYYMYNTSPENLPLPSEHPEETVSTIPTYVFRRSPKQIKKKPQQYTLKLKRGSSLQLLMKILGW